MKSDMIITEILEKIYDERIAHITIEEWNIFSGKFPYVLARLIKKFNTLSMKCYYCKKEYVSRLIVDDELIKVCDYHYYECYYKTNQI